MVVRHCMDSRIARKPCQTENLAWLAHGGALGAPASKPSGVPLQSQVYLSCHTRTARMLVLAPQDSAIHQRLTEDLAQVRRLFAGELQSDLDCVNKLATYVERYHGKMLRPMLVLITAMAVRPDPQPDPQPNPQTDSQLHPRLQVAAAVVEMVHMATLVHDDVLDDAQMRRRGATINHLRGNEAAVMLGDYLISHAYHLCSSLGSAAISRIVADATNTVCEGELLQLDHRNNLALDEPTYFQAITRKTASLCGACCRVAAELCGCDQAVTAAVTGYGRSLGVAFQVVDDVLDLTGDPATVGKTLGQDLAKGKMTLPLIHAMASVAGPQREALEGLLLAQTDPSLSDQARAQGAGRIRELLEAGDSLKYARGKALGLIADAKASILEHLSDSPARTFMLDMADAVITRRS